MKPNSNIIETAELHNRSSVFDDRVAAGHVLAELLSPQLAANTLLLAIPAGGFPVARTISEDLQLPLDFLVASKMLLPGNTEAGFGAVAFDGSEWLNQPLIDAYRLSEKDIAAGRREAISKVQRRFTRLCHDRVPDIKGRQVIVVDDGLASGATLYATLKALKKLEPAQLVVALPTGSEKSVQQLAQHCDLMVCANIRAGYPYAVANAYRTWNDVDENVLLAWLAKQ